MVRTVADLYSLNESEIASLERLGEKSARNIIEAVDRSLQVPFERVLFALGIRFVGETVAKKLANSFVSIEALEAATLDDLVDVDEIGPRIAQSVRAYFENEQNRNLIKRLKEAGVQMRISEDRLSGFTDKLDGATIVISGTLHTILEMSIGR